MSSEIIKKAYYSVIPADVRYHPSFKGGDPRLLYGEVSALCNERGYCWATNDYFAELYQVESRTIQRWLIQLVKADFIYIDNSKGRRKIFIAKKHAVDIEEYTDEDVPEQESGVVEKPVKAKKVVKVTKKNGTKFSDEDLFMAELLLQKVIYNFPHFSNKKIVINEWADDMRKLREIDKATKEQIVFMITWIQGGEIPGKDGKPGRTFEPHEFWSKNILSAKKLRKQWFENLVPQLQDTVKKHVKKSTVTQL